MVSFSVHALFSLLTLSAVYAKGPIAIPLYSAGSYTILAKSGISTVPQSAITGNIGVSPAAGTAITGFSLTLAPAGTSSTSTQVVGDVHAASYKSPTPSKLTLAVLDMQSAFLNGRLRVLPTALNLAAGLLTSTTFTPGLYKWTSGVTVTTAITFAGSSKDVWIFQIQNDLLFDSAAQTFLTGGALPKNIFWVVSGSVNLNTGSLLKGVILTATNAALATGASVNGRILAQTSVTLQQSTVNPA